MTRRLTAALLPPALLLALPAVALAVQINPDFKPQNEFKTDPWIPIEIGPLDLSINKAVFYLFLGAAATCVTMIWIARKMQDRPNRVQTAVEAAYDLVSNTITRENMGPRMARRWFPFIATLFFFIWWSNMIGFIPMPVETEHKLDIFGLEVPALAIYA